MISAYATLARLALKWRRERDAARYRADQLLADNRRLRATNHQLSATVRRMDAVNAQLTEAARTRDFTPHGGFDPADGGDAA